MSGTRSRESSNQTMNQTATNSLSDRARGVFDSEIERLRGMEYDPVGSADIARFSNPYQQDVIDATMGQLNQSRLVGRNQQMSDIGKAGAFGDKRRGIMEAELEGQQDRTAASTLAGLNSANFGQARDAAMAESGSRNAYGLNVQQLLQQLLAGSYGQEGTTQTQGTQSGSARRSGTGFGFTYGGG
jgi:hypothetical protein